MLSNIGDVHEKWYKYGKIFVTTLQSTDEARQFDHIGNHL